MTTQSFTTLSSGMDQLQPADQEAVVKALVHLLTGKLDTDSAEEALDSSGLSSVDGLRVLLKVLKIVEAQPKSIVLQPDTIADALRVGT